MCTDEPGAPGSKDHSTIESALSGSLCTNDTSLPGMEIISRSPGRFTIPLPLFVKTLISFLSPRDAVPWSHIRMMPCREVSRVTLRLEGGERLLRHALGCRLNDGKRERLDLRRPGALDVETTYSIHPGGYLTIWPSVLADGTP